MTRLRTLQASFLLTVMLTACAAFAPPRTLSQDLVYAQTTATAAMELATPLVEQGLLKPDQAQVVLDSANLVRRTVETARAFSAHGDAANAQAQLQAITVELDMLSTFIRSHRGSP